MVVQVTSLALQTYDTEPHEDPNLKSVLSNKIVHIAPSSTATLGLTSKYHRLVFPNLVLSAFKIDSGLLNATWVFEAGVGAN